MKLAGVGAVLLLATVGARVAPVPEAQRSAEQQSIAARFATAGMPNAVGAYLNHPTLAQAILPNEQYVSRESTLSPRHRALVNLRTAWLAHSNYLWAHHAEAARQSGMTSAELTRIARGPDAKGWDTFEISVLRAADELHVDSFVSDATWGSLAARYDTNQLIDLVYGAGDVTMHAGAINSLGVQIEPGFRDRLPSGITYTVGAARTNVRLLGREPRIPPVEAATGRANGNVFRTFVRNPPADRLRGAVTTHIRNGTTLPPRYRELLLMRIGALCRSEYEWAAHSRIGRQTGMTDADVERIASAPAVTSDPVEAALLHAADELYQDDRVSNATWAALAKVFDTKQLLDVLIAVGGYRTVSMAINSAGVQLDANMADFRFPASVR